MKLSAKADIQWAIEEGYKMCHVVDHEFTIANGDATVYRATLTSCDCPDWMRRNGSYHIRLFGGDVCKHVSWVWQIERCCYCGSWMLLNAEHEVYECVNPLCGDAKQLALVLEERSRTLGQQHAA